VADGIRGGGALSNRDPEIRRNKVSSSVRFVLGQFQKSPNTAIPGIVHAYDPGTRRATVQPAIDLLMTDGTRMSQPLIPNVPVVWPATRQWTLVAPLAAGDAVMLVISQRGLTDFKRRFRQAAPDVDRIMSLSDAVAIPGFGPTQITPASAEGIALQSADGETSLTLEPDGRLLHNGEPLGSGPQVPGEPPNFTVNTAFAPGRSTVRFMWGEAPSPALYVHGYDGQVREVDASTWTRWQAQLGATTRDHITTSTFLQRHTDYVARVRAYNSDGPGPWATLEFTTG